MRSAFGIDHGEISKVRAPRMPGNARRARKKTRSPGGQSGPSQVKEALNRVGEANISLKGVGEGAGRTAQGIGGFLERRPGLAGTALVGGTGVAGYHVLSQREPKRKKTP